MKCEECSKEKELTWCATKEGQHKYLCDKCLRVYSFLKKLLGQ